MPANTTIMVVEDETSSRVTLCDTLENAGYGVVGLEKGSKAMEMIRHNPFNIIITDTSFPDVSGLEILELAKEIDPDVAVIMMTGYTSTEEELDTLNQGAYAYFVKPINPDEIKTTIANALKQQMLSLQNKRLVDSLQHSNKLLFEANDQLSRATQAKSEFLSHMSHELRTPLNIIIGFSELMIDRSMGEINDKQKQCINDIMDSSHHLLNLINSVLDLSKIESGKMELNMEAISLSKVIESLTRTMMPILTPRNQNLDMKIEDKLPPVHVDKAKLKQVLFNLISNASWFSPDGGKLKIGAVRKGNCCQVSVIDNGIGIKKEDQLRIFEPFCQLDNPLTREKGGTGLGLTLVKQIIETHGGQTWVESEYGRGSRFTFTLPLVTTDYHI